MRDAEWALIAPLLPLAKRLGRRRTTAPREVVTALFYLLRGGASWRLLAKEVPPRSPVQCLTAQRYFYDWRADGVRQRINHAFWMRAPLAAGREASPSAAAIDSQSVKRSESDGPRGPQADKKVKEHKRHLPTDTGGLVVTALVPGADIQDRDGAPAVLGSIRGAFPWLHHVLAERACVGDQRAQAPQRLDRWTLEMVKPSAGAKRFEALPRHWVLAPTLAWLTHNRRLGKDFEASIAAVRAWLFLASVQILGRRSTRA